MSKSNQRKVIAYNISQESHFYTNNHSKQYIHESEYFYVKGKNNNLNGVVLTKFPQITRSIEIVDKHGQVITVPWKVFYFDSDDVDKEIVVITEDLEEKRFRYSPTERRIVEVEKPPVVFHPNYLY